MENDDLSEISLTRLTADGFAPCAVVETSAGNFQAWLKHCAVFPKLIGTFAAQTLAARYDADPSAADWRRFGTTSWLHELQAQIQEARRPLPVRSSQEPHR